MIADLGLRVKLWAPFLGQDFGFAFVLYATSGGGSPLGQSASLAAKSGRSCPFMNAATSNASCGVRVPGLSKGMLLRTKAAVTRRRAIPAPMLNERAPQTGGAKTPGIVTTGAPSPSAPWHRTHCATNTVAPRAPFGTGGGTIESMPWPVTRWPTAMPLETHLKYDTMSRMSRLSGSSARPFMLRMRQSLIRSSISSTPPRRDRYCRYRAYTPTYGIAYAPAPSSRWQLLQRRSLPTFPGSESRVAAMMARPRRTDLENGSSLRVDSAGVASRCATGVAGGVGVHAATAAADASI